MSKWGHNKSIQNTEYCRKIKSIFLLLFYNTKTKGALMKTFCLLRFRIEMSIKDLD